MISVCARPYVANGHLPVASRIRVVPVSTIPAVVDRIVVEPYLMDSLIPQYWLAG